MLWCPHIPLCYMRSWPWWFMTWVEVMYHVTRFDSLTHMTQGLLGYDQQFSHEKIAQWNEQLESQRQNLLVQMEQSSTDKKTLANSLGEQQPKRRKANSDKDRRIFSIVQNYHSYEDDVVLCEMFMLLWYYSIRVWQNWLITLWFILPLSVLYKYNPVYFVCKVTKNSKSVPLKWLNITLIEYNLYNLYNLKYVVWCFRFCSITSRAFRTCDRFTSLPPKSWDRPPPSRPPPSCPTF
jgi:hypothetical protein